MLKYLFVDSRVVQEIKSLGMKLAGQMLQIILERELLKDS